MNVYLVDDDHFHTITGITGFFSTIYFCERCLKHYNNKEMHERRPSNFPMTLIVAIELRRAKVLLNKPNYFSMIILDLTKYAMYDLLLPQEEIWQEIRATNVRYRLIFVSCSNR